MTEPNLSVWLNSPPCHVSIQQFSFYFIFGFQVISNYAQGLLCAQKSLLVVVREPMCDTREPNPGWPQPWGILHALSSILLSRHNSALVTVWTSLNISSVLNYRFVWLLRNNFSNASKNMFKTIVYNTFYMLILYNRILNLRVSYYVDSK